MALANDKIAEFSNEDEIDQVISKLQQHQDATETEELPDPIDVLEKVMQTKGLRKSDLKIYMGSAGNVGDVLKRRRPLSLTMIRNLHKGLGIPAEILIQKYL